MDRHYSYIENKIEREIALMKTYFISLSFLHSNKFLCYIYMVIFILNLLREISRGEVFREPVDSQNLAEFAKIYFRK